jgi:response regulator RpfG family c-di-GMP phosphodiesterase
MGHFSDKLDDIYLEQIGPAAILHDVGKVSTPDHILQKPGKLTPEEFAIMREHAETGGTILERAASLAEGSSYLSLGAEIAMSHHERWDGNGYPHGLSQEEIPLSARIVAVADVYDALISNRPYKDPWPLSEALDYIRKGAGQQFDPRVVEAFLAVIEDKMAV